MPIPAGTIALSTGPAISGIDGDAGGNSSGHVFNFNGDPKPAISKDVLLIGGSLVVLAIIYKVVK